MTKTSHRKDNQASKLQKESGLSGHPTSILEEMAREVAARDRRLKLLRSVIPIGVKLSAERDFNRLLETIVIEAQMLCNADAGTLYLKTDDDMLRFVVIRNNSLDISAGGTTGREISFPALRLYDENGNPNHHNVATYAALSHTRVIIADAYNADGFDFSGTKAFDARTGYRSKSFLTIPLEGEDKVVIGVLQLINAKEPETGEIIPFDPDEVIESLVLLAYAALSAYIREESLRQEIEKLRIEIDLVKQERQVAEITETEYFQRLQRKVDELKSRRY